MSVGERLVRAGLFALAVSIGSGCNSGRFYGDDGSNLAADSATQVHEPERVLEEFAREAYCNPNASTSDMPLRIMLLIDTSDSMGRDDPQAYRLAAARDLINGFPSGTDVKFSLVTFDDFAVPATVDEDGKGIFTNDREVLEDALIELSRADGFRNYLGVLEYAREIISNEFSATAQGDAVEPMRPFFFIVFLQRSAKLRGSHSCTELRAPRAVSCVAW